MNLKLDILLANGYKNKSQIARIITENWVEDNSYCPCCGNNQLKSYENNRPVADFFCIKCSEEFELKSKNGKIARKIIDGSYDSMIARINSLNNPNFFFLSYNKEMYVENFLIIPKHFFSEEIIEKRKPLAETARRAGWIGCNINLTDISSYGKVFLIKNSKVFDIKTVTSTFQKTLFIRDKNEKAKGWILDTLKCIDSIDKDIFFLKDIYKFENFLKIKYPNNNFIKDKVRQQLQILRDKGLIEFIGRGKYRKVYNEKF